MSDLDAKTARLRALRLARDADKPKPIDRREHYRVFGLDTKMPFGKFKFQTLEYVMDHELSYVTWLLENTDFEMTRDAEEEYQARLDPRRPSSPVARYAR